MATDDAQNHAAPAAASAPTSTGTPASPGGNLRERPHNAAQGDMEGLFGCLGFLVAIVAAGLFVGWILSFAFDGGGGGGAGSGSSPGPCAQYDAHYREWQGGGPADVHAQGDALLAQCNSSGGDPLSGTDR